MGATDGFVGAASGSLLRKDMLEGIYDDISEEAEGETNLVHLDRDC